MTNEDLSQIREVVRAEVQEVRDVVRSEVQQVREAFRTELQQFREVVREEATAAINTAIAAAEERSQEFTRKVETNLLTAFHSYAKGQVARWHTTEITAADLAIRMAALEERMLNLETRRSG